MVMSAETTGVSFSARTTCSLLALCSSVLMYAAFLPYGMGLAFVCLVPLLVTIRHQTCRRAFMLGWLAGSAGYALIGFGFTESLLNYFGLGPWAVFFLGAMLALSLGLPLAVFCAVMVPLWRSAHRVWSLLVGAVVLAVLDVTAARYYLPSHATQLVGSLWRWPLLLQTADLFGTAGPMFLLGIVNLAIAEVLHVAKRGEALGPALRPVAAVGLIVVAGLAYGVGRSSSVVASDADALRVAYCQTRRPSPEDIPLADAVSDVFVLPETSVDLTRAGDTEWLAEVLTRCRRVDSQLLAGVRRHGTGDHRPGLFNSVAHLCDGAVRWYDKRRLVPFSEYYPLEWLDPLGCRRAGWEGISHGQRGQPLFSIKGHAVCLLICYELMESDLVARDVRRGAEVIIGLSNEEAFAANSLADRGVGQCVLRAIESRRPVVKVDKAGHSMAVDARGRIMVAEGSAASGSFRRFSIRPGNAASFYMLTEPAQLPAGVLLCVVGFFLCRRRWLPEREDAVRVGGRDPDGIGAVSGERCEALVAMASSLRIHRRDGGATEPLGRTANAASFSEKGIER